MNILDFEKGMSFSYERKVLETDVVEYAEISGDRNPVHLDEIYAQKSPFGSRVAHGMLTASFISKVFGMDFPGPGCIYLSQTLKFKKPVYINDTVSVNVEITDINTERSLVEFDTTCSVNEEIVLTGKAEIYIPRVDS